MTDSLLFHELGRATLTYQKTQPPASSYLSHLQAVINMYGGGDAR